MYVCGSWVIKKKHWIKSLFHATWKVNVLVYYIFNSSSNDLLHEKIYQRRDFWSDEKSDLVFGHGGRTRDRQAPSNGRKITSNGKKSDLSFSNSLIVGANAYPFQSLYKYGRAFRTTVVHRFNCNTLLFLFLGYFTPRCYLEPLLPRVEVLP